MLLCQNGLDVLEGLCSLGGDAFRDQAGGRIDGQLPGYIDGLPCSDALRIGSDGGGSIGGNDHLFHPIFSFSICRH